MKIKNKTSQWYVNFFRKICFLVNIGLALFNFPAKKLRKIRALKIRMRRLFLKKIELLKIYELKENIQK